MILFACILSGAIGASIAAGMWPGRSFSGGVNVGLGFVGGTLAWAGSNWLALLEPNLSTFITILTVGGISGALLTLGLGSLRNILIQSR